MKLALVTTVALASSCLSGCSYSIDLLVTVIEGKVAFAAADDSFDCIENIIVTAVDGWVPEPSPGDDVALVRNGRAYWYTDNSVLDCSTKFPIIYGQQVGQSRPSVSPKQLRVGITYKVTTSGGGAYGHASFRINPDRTLVMLPAPN